MKSLVSIIFWAGLGISTSNAEGLPPVSAFFLGSGHLTENGLDKGTPLADGTEVKVYWDWDKNGPDAKDPQPVVGEKAGEANFNLFKLNSAELGAETGQFLTDPMFNIVGYLPEPATYYLRVCLDERQLVSNVVTLTPGMADYEFTKWEVVEVPCKKK